MFANVEWYVQLVIYLLSFSLSATVLYTIDWAKIIAPRFQNDNWPIILYLFMATICALLIGVFVLTITTIAMP